MRTREMTGFIHRDAVDKEYIEFFQEHLNVSPREYVKARLIIELPEKQIEITESQFEAKVKNCLGDLIGDSCLSALNEEFFGKEEM